MAEPTSSESSVDSSVTKKAKTPISSKEMDAETLNVEKPTDTDVLCGRGAPINMHPGNVIYRQVVKHNKPLYQTCEKFEKYRVAQSIVEALMGRNPQVRFLEACGNETDGTRSWKIVPKDKAVKKTIQALRERDRKPARDELPKRYQSMPCHIPSSSNVQKYGTESRVENNGGKEDWQVLFHHLLPETATDFKGSQSNPSDDSRLTSGIVIGEGQAKADGATKTQEKYNKIQHGSGGSISTEEAKPQSKHKSLHRLMFDGLSVVEEVAPGSFISSSPSPRASMASCSASAGGTSEMSIEGFKTNSIESPIVAEVSVEDSKAPDDNSYISGYGDAGDAYSINSDFGLSPVPGRSVAGDLSEYSIYQTELAECKSKAKGQDQWNYDMDFETIDDQMSPTIKSNGSRAL